jgi:hypothetical protein
MAGLTDLRGDRRSVTGTPDAEVIGASYDELGALIIGRAMFDAGGGADPPFGMPVFVVTSSADCWTSSRSTSCRCYSAAACHCSVPPAVGSSGSGSPRRTG